jgi:hypothetical protein
MNVIVNAGGIATLTEQIRAQDAGILPKVAVGLQRGLQRALGIANAKYLSGPRPQRLGVVTRRLRDSITTRVLRTEESVIGQLGTNVPYAGYHELGFHGSINVSAHTRTVAELYQGRTLDSRRPIRDRAGNVIGYKESRTTASGRNGTIGITQQVRAHTRQVNYAGRPFLAPALKDSLPFIVREIRAEIAK